MELIKPKILIFIDWFLPGYKAGGPVTSNANLIAHLKDEFEFYVITRDTDYCETVPYSNIKSDTWNEMEKDVHVYYFSKEKLNYGNIRRVVKALDFDIAFINGIYSFYFSILPLFLTKQKKQIVSSRGMISSHSMSVSTTKKKFFFRLVRLFQLYSKVLFHITTEEEDCYIRKLLGNHVKTHLAPNLPKKIIAVNNHPVTKEKNFLKLSSIARIAPEKNTLFAIETLAECTQGEIFLQLYGAIYDNEYWRECQNRISRLPENVRITYEGTVSGDDLKKAYTESHFLFMPTRGENFGHSILESLTYGRPVIISDQTPWRNLEAEGIGWDISLDDKQKFVQIIQQCAEMNQDDYNRMSNKAFEYAQKVVNNPEIVEQNRQLFKTE
jgi:glycosyltransferase involved in cell wall biosynthesis